MLQEAQHQVPPTTTRVAFKVVALVASAGGLEALSTILRDLPPAFPVGVLVMQHLSGRGSSLVDILRRRTHLPVDWTEDGDVIAPGRVLLGPPGKRLEVLPDGTCSLTPGTLGDLPLDSFLESLADSFGPGVLAVVLTGMGRDGAAGASAIKNAGGTVIVQSEDTAEQPSMPRAAIRTGAADLVLPLHEIGPVIADVMAGGRTPRLRAQIEAAAALFAGPGEACAALREVDWSSTPLGSVIAWPQSLRTTVATVLASRFAMSIYWGPELTQIYNDAFIDILGPKHPVAGLPASVAWAEIWDYVRGMFETVVRTGQATYEKDQSLELSRRGAVEEAYFTFSNSPLYDDDGEVRGVLTTGTETTQRVLAERRVGTLLALAGTGTGVETANQACERAAGVLAKNPSDVPFVLLYLLDGTATLVRLCASAGVESSWSVAPLSVDLQGGHPAWPLARAVHGEPVLLEDLPSRLRGFHAGPWPQAPRSALLLPLRPAAGEPASGVLIAGISPRLPFDAAYRGFLELVAAQVGAILAEARARHRERERLERLAELDRVKTEFFSNVSHEFRTPLTLLLAPLEELLRRHDELPGGLAEEIEIASRNARRLLGLVDTLLDFSQVEAGRLRAQLEPTDLAALTADIASVFRSAAERAGLELRVDCPPLPAPVWVDCAMWEKVVSNLLSNALKFTFEGEIAVELRALPQHAELVVRDTGEGIPQEELPHLFKRFHRVRGVRARTQQGAGIGLALVHELVRRHHGRVRVRSREGEGTTFTVWIPSVRRASAGDAAERKPPRGTAEVAAALAEEASRWDADGHAREPRPTGVVDDPLGPPAASPLRRRAPGARVLVVDDNADMRDYLRRLLAPHWEVDTAGNGEEALERARRSRPSLILTDVMMPSLDGFGLLRALREEERLRTTPVVLLTARAGEEAAIDGLLAGADDYITKPFSARELVARVGAQLELSAERARTEAALEEDLRGTRILRDVSARLISEGDVQVLYQEILGAAIALTHADAGTVQIFAPERRELLLLAAQGFDPTMTRAFHGVDASSSTPCGLALASGERTFVDFDVPASADPDGSFRMHVDAGYLSAQSTPLIARSGRPIGMVSTHWRIHRRPTERELTFLDLLARQAADLVERHETDEALERSHERLERRVAERTAELRESEERFRALVDASAQKPGGATRRRA